MRVCFFLHVLIFQSSMKNRLPGLMKTSHLVGSLLILFTTFQLNGQKSVLYGKAADYASKEIKFYRVSDPILHEKTELATTNIDSDGSFSVIFSLSQTTEIYTDLEKYRGTIVVEPGKNYRVELPPYSPKTSGETHSSYFKPALYWLGLPGADNTDLNFSVRSFLTDLNLETVKNSNQIYQQKSKEVVSAILALLEKKYGSIKNPYFKTLMNYSFAELEYPLYQRNTDFLITKYFASASLELAHPAYQQAFETLFTDFLRKQSLNIQNNKLISLTDSGNFSGLVSFFESRGFSKEFAELVVLKGLYDGYYTGGFSKDGVIQGVEFAGNTILSPLLQPLANQIKNKLAHLAVGGKAPALRLSNLKHETVTLDQYAGKFIYLSFFNSASADCRGEIELIVSLEKELRQVLNFVSISLDDDFENASKLWISKGYSWELLNGSKQKQLIDNYNASSIPAFYLIAPDGTLKLSQAPFPSHGFDQAFLKILRDHNFKEKSRSLKPVN